jgi:hypothetical protein
VSVKGIVSEQSLHPMLSFNLKFIQRHVIVPTVRSISTRVTPLCISPLRLHHLQRSGDPIQVVDATWMMPNSHRNPHQEFLSRRIPSAQFLDIDDVASPHELGLKHMMPSARVFADACRVSCRGPYVCAPP